MTSDECLAAQVARVLCPECVVCGCGIPRQWYTMGSTHGYWNEEEAAWTCGGHCLGEHLKSNWMNPTLAAQHGWAWSRA